MTLEFFLNPMTVYAIAVAGLLTALSMFVGIKREIAKAKGAEEETNAKRALEQLAVRDLENELETLRATVRNLEAVPSGRPAGIGINLTKRAQALRMHHRGESIPSIAAALETPTNEIALLLKLQGLTN